MSATENQAAPAERAIRWGILGTGNIAAAFAGDLRHLNDAEVVAVGSRRQANADAFADRFDIPHRHKTYQLLVSDSDVDVIYISTPQPFHHENAMLAIRAGKHALVEKPFTLNAPQARGLVTAAREESVFLMEAMWTRFLPHVVDIRNILNSGLLGDVRTVTADHGQWFARDPEFRLFSPTLGGGALLDLGIYPISFSSMVLGKPSAITAVSDPTFTGVDGQTSVILQHEGGRHAILTSSLEALSANRATIVGTEARVEVDSMFYTPTSFTVVYRDDRVDRHEHIRVGNGLHYEAAAVGRCLRGGLVESPIMSLAESIELMETMDEVRHQIGLVFPQEGVKA